MRMVGRRTRCSSSEEAAAARTLLLGSRSRNSLSGVAALTTASILLLSPFSPLSSASAISFTAVDAASKANTVVPLHNNNNRINRRHCHFLLHSATMMDNTNDTVCGTTVSSSISSSSTAPTFACATTRIHLVVLVHGWLGNPHELRYLQKALETQHHHQQSSSGKNNNDDATTKSVLFVHAATANDGRTNDGVLAGGRRLAEEINDWIDRVILQFQHEYPEEEEADLQQSTATSSSPPPSLGPHISLSLVGNSLGGLYARCALKDIRWHRSASVGILRRIEIQPAVFCTIATPHLGVAWPHSYLPNPQLMKGAAWFLSLVGGDSLRDLFFVPSSEERGVLEDLAMQSAFVDPLSAFRHRLALANAYPTDFQVPLSTAAFLSRTPSRHNHPKEENNDYWVHTDDDARSTVASDSNYNNPQCSTIAINTTKEPNEHSWLALMVETNRNIADETLPLDPSPLLQTPSLNNNNSADSTIHGNNEKSANLGVKSTTTDEMALRLDALGWTKVFCDMRQNVPSLPIPFWPVAAAGTLEQLDDATVTPPPAVDTNVFFPTRDDNKDNSVYYTSTELWDRFSPYLSKLPSSSTSPEQEHQQYRYFLPLGHTVLVANAKNEQYAQLNAAGQPVMDALATRLLRLVSSHSPPTTKNKMLAPKIRL